MSATVIIRGCVYFAGSGDVWLEPAAVELTPIELADAVETAFRHSRDWPLVESHCSGEGPFSAFETISLEAYLHRLAEWEAANRRAEASARAKQRAIRRRRSDFESQRDQILLAMIAAGREYVCAHPGCEVCESLTIDHSEPLSKGGSDEIHNLRFLCNRHNAAKGDR